MTRRRSITISRLKLREIAQLARSKAVAAVKRLYPDGVGAPRIASIEQFETDVLGRMCISEAFEEIPVE